MFLTDEVISDLLQDEPAPAARKGRKVFTSEGWVSMKVNATTVGAFEGKAGSLRRSRKGRTYRMANGRRFYNDLEATVLAYKAR